MASASHAAPTAAPAARHGYAVIGKPALVLLPVWLVVVWVVVFFVVVFLTVFIFKASSGATTSARVQTFDAPCAEGLAVSKTLPTGGAAGV